jgi:hypothetical protein
VVCLGLGLTLLPACGADDMVGDETSDGDSEDSGDGESGTDDTGTDSTGTTDTGDTTGDGDGTTGDGDGTTGDGDGDGMALPVDPNGEWTWFEAPGTFCRDGSQAGFGYRAGTENKLIVYLQGGNACFNFGSCIINPDSIDSGNHTYEDGIMDQANPDNPVAGWAQVYIPQCTGDVYSGNNPGFDHPDVPGGPQDFVGHRNVQIMLDYIVPTFPDQDQVMWAGYSAGGFGAAWNYDIAAEAFAPTEVALIDDAGPPMDTQYFTPCLQDTMNEIWGWTTGMTLPLGCPDCDDTSANGVINYVAFLNDKYPDASLGIVTSYEDFLIRQFWSYGNNDCNVSQFIPGNYDGATFRAGLEDLRDNWTTGPQWGTFYVNGSQHTFTSDNGFYSATANGVLLTDWVQDIVDGNPNHVAD